MPILMLSLRINVIADGSLPSALITGASREALARSAAFAFAEAGWDLIRLSAAKTALQSLATELASTGRTRSCCTAAVDLTKPEEIAPGVKTLLSQGLTPLY